MRATLQRYYERYCLHHDMDRPLLQWIGVVGAVAFPLFYLLRRASLDRPVYDDIGPRAVATVLCVVLALRVWWPAPLRRFYIGYSYLVVFYCLSFLLAFTMLMNGGGTLPVVNMIMGTILIILLADWRNAVVMLMAGYVCSLAAYMTLEPDPQVPPMYLASAITSILVVVVGALSHYGQKRAELERMRRLYAGLAGSIAHEMRNPLMQVRHLLDSLESSLAAGAPAPVEVGQVIRQGQDAVTRGLQGISLTLQQLNPNTCDPASLRHMSAAQCVRNAVDEFAYDGPLQRTRVRVDEVQDFVLNADEAALRMVLFNLLKNALYYLPTHPGMAVTVTVDGRDGANCIVVHDTGPGIPAERLPGLFEEFSSAGKSEGTGLGLAFCRRAMRAFGGDIGCESTPGAFTRFSLRFPAVPLAQVEADRDDMLQWARLALAGRQILVVDDEAVMRRATGAKLAAMGCEVDEADGAEQALERLRHAGYDLILMDINMPGLDGFELTRSIRGGAVPGHQHVAILGFTALPASMVGDRARQCGMAGLLNKGCDALELARSIARAVTTSAPGAGATPVPALAGRAILMAEDNAFNRAIVKAHLTRMGADVIEAEHGRQVLRLLDAGLRPAAILMDLEMPGLDGLATARALRALPPPLGAVPIVALTGHGAAERHQAARAAGMDGVLAKPVEAAALRAELLRVLGAAPQVVRTGTPGPDATGLLNTRRIDDFERMGVLGELLPGCFGEIRRFVQQLEQSLAVRDRLGANQALHSLVGISGEAGAQALHLAAKGYYGALATGAWPAEPDWLEKIRQLATATERAVQDRYSHAWLSSAPGALGS